MRRHPVITVLGLILLVIVVWGAWLAWTGIQAAQALNSAKTSLLKAREGVVSGDLFSLSGEAASAQKAAHSAKDSVSGFAWNLAADLPLIGDTPAVVQAVATSAASVTDALVTLGDAATTLNADSLFSNGKLDAAALQSATPSLTKAQAELATAVGLLQAAPSTADGAWIVGPVADARDELEQQTVKLSGQLSSASAYASILPSLLGTEKPMRYFLGVQNPNEQRAAGGFLGSWAILDVRDGSIDVTRTGIINELPTIEDYPKGISKEFRQLYAVTPPLPQNMNMSPHFPNTARLWIASAEKFTGEKLDGAIGIDTTALQYIVQASTSSVQLPDGSTLPAKDIAEYLAVGIFEKFPGAGDAAQRKAFQQQLGDTLLRGAFNAKGASRAQAEALRKAAGENRIGVWSEDLTTAKTLENLGAGGSLNRSTPTVRLALNQSSGSKLDSYLQQKVAIDPGQCVTSDGRLYRTLQWKLTSVLPAGPLPPYVATLVTPNPKGPVNSQLVAVTLPKDAKVAQFYLDGRPMAWLSTPEEGHARVGVSIDLPPGKSRTLDIRFTEPRRPVRTEVITQPGLGTTPVSVLPAETNC